MAVLSDYQKFVIFILAITQFTVILDFMVMSPLGDMLMRSLSIKPAAFGVAISGYAISAGVSIITRQKGPSSIGLVGAFY